MHRCSDWLRALPRRYATALRAALDHPCAPATGSCARTTQKPATPGLRRQRRTGTTCRPPTGTEPSPGYRNLTSPQEVRGPRREYVEPVATAPGPRRTDRRSDRACIGRGCMTESSLDGLDVGARADGEGTQRCAAIRSASGQPPRSRPPPGRTQGAAAVRLRSTPPRAPWKASSSRPRPASAIVNSSTRKRGFGRIDARGLRCSPRESTAVDLRHRLAHVDPSTHEVHVAHAQRGELRPAQTTVGQDKHRGAPVACRIGEFVNLASAQVTTPASLQRWKIDAGGWVGGQSPVANGQAEDAGQHAVRLAHARPTVRRRRVPRARTGYRRAGGTSGTSPSAAVPG